MSSVAAVPRNTGVLFIGRVVAQGLAVVLTVVLAARLGVSGFGEYALVSAVVFLANVATTFGTDMVLIREVAGHARLDRWVAAFAVQLALSVIAIVAIWLVAPVIPGQGGHVVTALRIMSLTLLPAALFSVCTAVLRGVGMMAAYAALGVGAAAVQLGAVVIFVGPGSDVVRVAAVLLSAQVLIGIGAWAMCVARIGDVRAVPRLSRFEVGAMARASASIGVLGLLGVAYQRVAAIAVSVLVGPAATGWFAGASRIVEASKTGHLALFGAVYPAMAEASADEQSDERHRAVLHWSWRLCVVLGGVVTAGLLLLGPFLIEWLYGPAFAPSEVALAILALAVVPSTVATYQSLSLLAAHREADNLRVLGASLAVLLVALAALIPTIGWRGGCWAVVIADTTQAGLMLLARANLDRRPQSISPLVSNLQQGTR